MPSRIYHEGVKQRILSTLPEEPLTTCRNCRIIFWERTFFSLPMLRIQQSLGKERTVNRQSALQLQSSCCCSGIRTCLPALVTRHIFQLWYPDISFSSGIQTYLSGLVFRHVFHSGVRTYLSALASRRIFQLWYPDVYFSSGIQTYLLALVFRHVFQLLYPDISFSSGIQTYLPVLVFTHVLQL